MTRLVQQPFTSWWIARFSYELPQGHIDCSQADFTWSSGSRLGLAPVSKTKLIEPLCDAVNLKNGDLVVRFCERSENDYFFDWTHLSMWFLAYLSVSDLLLLWRSLFFAVLVKWEASLIVIVLRWDLVYVFLRPEWSPATVHRLRWKRSHHLCRAMTDSSACRYFFFSAFVCLPFLLVRFAHRLVNEMTASDFCQNISMTVFGAYHYFGDCISSASSICFKFPASHLI